MSFIKNGVEEVINFDLNKLLDLNKKIKGGKPKLDYDVAMLTCQCSHIWCVIDSKINSNGIDHFLLKAFLNNPFTSHLITELSWEKRVDIPTWLGSLNTQCVGDIEIKQLISSIVADLKHSEEDMNDIEQLKERLNMMDIPKIGWEIKETIDERNPIGMTEIICFELSDKYILLEFHLES